MDPECCLGQVVDFYWGGEGCVGAYPEVIEVPRRVWEICVNILVRGQKLAWVRENELKGTDDTEGPPDAIVYERPGLFSESNSIALSYAVLG